MFNAAFDASNAWRPYPQYDAKSALRVGAALDAHIASPSSDDCDMCSNHPPGDGADAIAPLMSIVIMRMSFLRTFNSSLMLQYQCKN